MKSIDFEDIYWDGRHYDLINENNKNIENDIRFFIRQAEKYGEPILEIGAGNGRVTIPLAEEGFQISALDIMKNMLAHGRQKAEKKKVTIEWIHADCRDFDLNKKFNLIISPGNALTHLHDRESLEKCFDCVRKHLNPEGRFIFTTFNPNLGILTRDPDTRYPITEYEDPDGGGKIIVTQSGIYDSADQIFRLKWFFKYDNDNIEKIIDLNMRMIYPQELNDLLFYNGFAIDAKFATYDETPFNSESMFQIAVCRIR
jgi:SAM-dependent methyltransferase